MIRKVNVRNKCNEDWNKMTAGETSRFCSSCERNVFDLSDKTPDEIYQIWKENNGKVCARIPQDSTYISMPAKVKEKRSGLWKKAVAMTLLALGFQASSGSSTIDDKGSEEIVSFVEDPGDPEVKLTASGPVVMRGKISSSVYGKNCKGAVLWVQGTDIKVTAGKDGFFEFEIPAPYLKDQGLLLEGRVHGYSGAMWIAIDEVGKNDVDFKIVHEEIIMEMGEMIIDDEWDEEIDLED